MRDGIRRDLEAKRARERAEAEALRVLRVGDIVSLCKSGQMSDRRGLEVIRQIVDGDADRIVRVGEEVRPDIQTGEQR